MTKEKNISQVVLVGSRFAPKNLGMLYQDETQKGTRLRIKLGDEMIGGVIFNNKKPVDYYMAMHRLSKKIGQPIQYVFIYQPVLPLETETYD